MDILQSLHNQLHSTTSEHVFIRKLAITAKARLVDRIDALASASKVNRDDSPEMTPELKAAERRRLKREHNEKSRALETESNDATIALDATLPAILQPAVGSELRANFKALPEDQQNVLLKKSSATRQALASVPVELSGLGEQQHARLVDEVRRELFPEQMRAYDADRAVIEAARQVHGAHRETVNQLFGQPVERHVTVLKAG